MLTMHFIFPMTYKWESNFIFKMSLTFLLVDPLPFVNFFAEVLKVNFDCSKIVLIRSYYLNNLYV